MGANRWVTCVLQRCPKTLLLSVAKNLTLFLNPDTVTSIPLTAQRSAGMMQSLKSKLPNASVVLLGEAVSRNVSGNV